MDQTTVAIRDIVKREVAPDEARDVVDYLLACQMHVSNARPLFGVLNLRSGALEWSAGGSDFYEEFQQLPDRTPGSGALGFLQLFTCFGIPSADLSIIIGEMDALNAGAAMSLWKPLEGAHDKFFRMVFHRYSDPDDNLVGFSLLDITPFQSSALRTRAMAEELLQEIEVPFGDGLGAGPEFEWVLAGVQRLLEMTDGEIPILAQELSRRVTRIAERLVEILRHFEMSHDDEHWLPQGVEQVLAPMIPVHSTPVSDWDDLHKTVLTDIDGEPAISGVSAMCVKYAYDFVSNAASTFVISPVPGRMFALNGPAGGKNFTTVDDLVRALGVEENSRRTAADFFVKLGQEPALGLFSVEGVNVEAMGRPGLYNGWQAMLVPGAGQGVDVRGLFHGLKNLILHLQVVYVIKNAGDVAQVAEGLAEVTTKIRTRLHDLKIIAETGRRNQALRPETPDQWLNAARRVAEEGLGQVEIVAGDIAQLTFQAPAFEMEDTFEELVRNAFNHGADKVAIVAERCETHIQIRFTDNGRGLTDDKLAQIRRVLATRRHDASLSTRQDGTGNGLLSAATAVSHFVDGQLSVKHAAASPGVEIAISMKLPSGP